MEHKDAEEILKRYTAGEATPEERAWVESWYLQEKQDLPAHDNAMLLADKASSLKALLADAGRKKRVLWPRIAAAVCLFLVLSAGIYYYTITDNVASRMLTATAIQPGRNAATLTLADGRKFILNDAAQGELIREAGLKISKSAAGELIYDVDDATGGTLALNTLSTGKGETYVVVLPDKSKVWLNAASSLKYLSNFSLAAERRVELQGEAYFEVAKDKLHPFIVTTGNQEVTVLGTHFNISAYADDEAVKTTLLEGAVRVAGQSGVNKAEKQLHPGEQAVLSANGLRVMMVDTELAVAWKNNEFMFEGASIQNIMKWIERWYDVEVIYKGEMPASKFGGAVSKFDDVSKVLRILEATKKVHFKIEGRSITVTK